MIGVILKSLFFPLLGTTIGSGCVFFLRGNIDEKFHKILIGFAAGVMAAASVWSLIIPAINQSEHMGVFSFVPAVVGFWAGIILMTTLDKFLPEPHQGEENKKIKKPSMLIPAVVIHNIPEGMAIGAVLASFVNTPNPLTEAAAITLSVGIAIQNFPEGSIISMPMASQGNGRFKSFFGGFLSGAVEPVAAWITMLFASIITPVLPYTLSFAAGAMIFVVVRELIPEISHGISPYIGIIMFSLGFTLMMSLDVALG